MKKTIENMTSSDAQEALRSGFEELVAAMVMERASAKCALVSSNHRPALVLSCAMSDIGIILGKQKDTLNKLRLLASLAGHQLGFSGVDVDVDDEMCHGDRQRGPRPKWKPKQDWDAVGFDSLANRFCALVLGRCEVQVDEVNKARVKATVAVMEPLPSGTDAKELQDALLKVLNNAAANMGRFITLEVLVN